MKPFKKGFGIAGQSTPEVKKPQKHDANLQKNSSLYFQIGLILCLLGAFFLFEMRFETKTIEIAFTDEPEDTAIEIPIDKYQIYTPKEKPKVVKQSQRITEEFIVKEDIFHQDIEKTLFTPNEPVVNTPAIDPGKMEDPIKVEDPVDVPYFAVQNVPIFPGCEKYTKNSDRRNCMSEKITRIIQKRFDTGIAIEYGLSGMQKIDVQFVVDKNGEVTGIKTRAPHPKLEEEAVRVINKIPQMKPGMQQDKPVNVIYTLPIKFDVRD